MSSILHLQRLATCGRYDPAAYLQLCHALMARGEFAAAKTYFHRWQRIDPGNRLIGYERTLLEADHLEQLPAAYIVAEFDGFADTFDGKLARLEYRVPTRFGELLDHGLGGSKLDRVLDLGCGTGLCGVHARPHARRLLGVDLSSGMLAKAARRDIYDELANAEFHAFLRACEDRFDLIVAGDSLIYVGDLRPLMGLASGALAPDGLMLMSFELAENGAAFQLPGTIRYKHGRSYVEAVVRESGMRIEHIEQGAIRNEGGMPVPGLIVLARCSGA